jgi:hypothetical protein
MTMNQHESASTRHDAQDLSDEQASSLSLEELENITGGGFINNWKQGVAFGVWPAGYSAAYAWNRWGPR